MPKNKTIKVLSAEVKIKTGDQEDFICLTDIAKSKNPEHPDDLIRNWLRSRNTLELLGIWEQLNNPGFNPVEFDGIRKEPPRLLNQLLESQRVHSSQLAALLTSAIHQVPKPEGAFRHDAPPRGAETRSKIFTS